MDHLLVPKHPARPTPRIRYYCSVPYDRGDFLTYPERLGLSRQMIFDSRAWQLFPSDLTSAIFQQWLFFGLLHAVIGDSVNFDDFIETEESSGRRYVHTRGLLSLAQPYLKKKRAQTNLSGNFEHIRYLKRCFEESCDINKVISVHWKSWGLDPYFVVSLAAMGQFWYWAFGAIYGPHEFDIFYRWRSPTVAAEDDDLRRFCDKKGEIDIFCLEMAKAGWCPRQVAIVGKDSFAVQYFCLQLSLPEPEGGKLDHRSCTQTKCLALQVVKSTYKTKHTRPDCRCHSAGVGTEELERILRKGDIPLVALDENGNLDLLSTEKCLFYTAISHVWSDGLGNPNENAMPLCQLQRIDKSIRNLPLKSSSIENSKIPFWIDTLCCPTEPPEARNLAIKRMRETYQNATGVLVLSEDLQSVESSNVTMFEQVYMISLSSWTSRLWTFQEGALAERLFIQFKDDVLEYGRALELIMKSIKGPFGVFVDYYSLFAQVMWVYGRGDMTHRNRNDPLSLGEAKEAMAFRSTSVAEDEAICLSSLLGVPMEPIIRAAPQDRMKAFWAHLPELPLGLLFWEAARMTEPGLRWAPRSFLGVPNSLTPVVVDGPNMRLTTDGLMVTACSITLDTLVPPLRFDLYDSLLIEDRNGKDLYPVAKMPINVGSGMESFSVPEEEISQVAIVLKDSSLRALKGKIGVMVFIYKVEDGVTYAHRGDSCFFLNYYNTPRVASLAEQKRDLEAQRSKPEYQEGDEYLKSIQGRTRYVGAAGTWNYEPRVWCID